MIEGWGWHCEDGRTASFAFFRPISSHSLWYVGEMEEFDQLQQQHDTMCMLLQSQYIMKVVTSYQCLHTWAIESHPPSDCMAIAKGMAGVNPGSHNIDINSCIQS